MKYCRQILPVVFAYATTAAAFAPFLGFKQNPSSSSPTPKSSTQLFASSSATRRPPPPPPPPPEEELKGFEGDVQIPSTGVSINDEMESSEKDTFETELVPITGYKHVAAQIVTTAESRGSFEPVRYLLSLSKPSAFVENTIADERDKKDTTEENNEKQQKEEQDKLQTLIENEARKFVMMDLPPFSPVLVAKMKKFMGPNSQLVAVLLTSRDGIHYDDAPAVYRMRRTDLEYWKQAFPGLEIVGYRLDIPRDCRESVTQVLDGYGPFAWQEEDEGDTKNNVNSIDSKYNASFVETGRPLTVMEWDHDIGQDILRGRKPLDADDAKVDEILAAAKENEDDYSPASIRAKEEGKQILAVYTPGHSFGSVSYVFPETGICCSGFTIPVEDSRNEENRGMDSAGPALDCRGYITTNRGGVDKKMESAKKLIETYCDRFNVVMPSRGDPLTIDGDYEEKKEVLLDILDQYERIGKIYEELGIFSDE